MAPSGATATAAAPRRGRADTEHRKATPPWPAPSCEPHEPGTPATTSHSCASPEPSAPSCSTKANDALCACPYEIGEGLRALADAAERCQTHPDQLATVRAENTHAARRARIDALRDALDL